VSITESLHPMAPSVNLDGIAEVALAVAAPVEYPKCRSAATEVV
jgi:hypothetical protein